MKTRMLLLVSSLLLAVSASAGSKVSEKRNLSGFEAIEISGSPKVVYTQGKTFSVRVEGERESVDDIETTVHGKTLEVRNKGKYGIFNITFGDSRHAVVYVTSPDLVSVKLGGSGDFESKSRVDTDRLHILLRGSGDIDFKDIICDHCKTELVGSGDIEIDRLEAIESTVSLIGSGDVKVAQWRVEKTEVSLKGSGDVTVNFVKGCRTASCVLQGSGDITLKGELGQLQQRKTGSGDINTGSLKTGR